MDAGWNATGMAKKPEVRANVIMYIRDRIGTADVFKKTHFCIELYIISKFT